MKYAAAFLLLTLAEKSADAAGIKAFLASVGAEADDAELQRLLAAVEGKDISAAIKDGLKKLVNVGGGGGGAAPAAAAAAGAPAAAAAAESSSESEEEADLGGAGGLFGGGSDSD